MSSSSVMDEDRARLVLGLPVQLPASALGLHQVLSTLGDSGVSAASELMNRSDALSACSLQPSSVSLAEARSSIARALFISTDSIAFICSASYSVHSIISNLSEIAVSSKEASPRRTTFLRAFRCFCSTVTDMARTLGVSAYFSDLTGSDSDRILFEGSLSSYAPFPTMETEVDHWTAAGVNAQTDITAYPLLLNRYSAVPLLLPTLARGIFQQVTEAVIWENRVMDRTLFNESFPMFSAAEAGLVRQAEAFLLALDPSHPCNLPELVTRFYTFACITLVIRAGFSAIESLFRPDVTIVIPAAIIDPCPHTGGRYGAALETAARIVNAGPRFLAGSEASWILTTGTSRTRALPRNSIPPVQIPATTSVPSTVPEFRVPDLPASNRSLDQGAGSSLPNPPPYSSAPEPVSDPVPPRVNEFTSNSNPGWSLLTASLKIVKSKYKLPSADACQKTWQNWKLSMLQFDEMWNIEPVKVLNAILLTIDAEDVRINGWFETQTKAYQANRKITMSEFCDYVLRQVICTSTTRKAAWTELNSLYKNISDISDCHVLGVKIKQLVNLIYPTNAFTAEVEAAPCTHREIILSLHNLTISLRDSDKRCVVVLAWKNYDVYSYATTFNTYLDSNLHVEGTSSVKVSGEYITQLFGHLEFAHRMHTQVTMSDKSKSNSQCSDSKPFKRKHSVQAFNTQGLRRHDADHAGRKRSAPHNRQTTSPSVRGGKNIRGSSVSRGAGRASPAKPQSSGVSKASHADDVDQKLAQTTFNRIGELFAKTDPELLLPNLQNLAYPNNQKSLTQCRKDLGRGMCMLCLAGRHSPANCHLLRTSKADSPEGKMAARFWEKYSKAD